MKAYTRFVLPLLLLIAAGANAQNPSFRAVCNVSEVVVGQPFELAFKLENARIKSLELPKFTDFEVMGPATSLAQSYINGKSSQIESHTYILTPKKAGTLNIGAATVQTNTGQRLTSQPIKLQVVKTSASSGPNASQRGDASIGDKVIVRAVPSNTNPVVGEQLVVDLRIYTQIDIRQIDLIKAPRAEDVFSHDIRNLDDEPQRVNLNGKQYTSKILHRAVIFPNKSGKLKISEALVHIGVYLNEQDAFFAELQNFRIPSEALEIDVVQPSNMPDDFNGTVGEYKMQAHVEAPKISSDDALRLVVKVQGTGDLKQVFAPKIEFGDTQFEAFPPNVSENIVENGRVLGGIKTFEYVLTPLAVGDFQIRPVFSYYDPAARRFVRQDTTIAVSVSQGKNPLQKPKKAAADTTKTSAQVDIAPQEPLESATFSAAPSSFFGSWWLWALAASLPAAGFALRRWQDKQAQNPTQQAKKETQKVQNNTQQQFAKAQQFLQNGDGKGFYAETAQALTTFLSHKLSVPFADLHKARIQQELAQRGLPETHIQQLNTVLQNCEMALYAGLTSQDSMQNTYNTVQNLVAEIKKLA